MGVETYKIRCFALGCEKETLVSVMTDKYGDFHVHAGDKRWEFSISTKIDTVRIHGLCPDHHISYKPEKVEEGRTVLTASIAGTMYDEQMDLIYVVFKIGDDHYRAAVEPLHGKELEKIRRIK